MEKINKAAHSVTIVAKRFYLETAIPRQYSAQKIYTKAKNIVDNFVSGIILIFDRPLKVGDSVEVGSHSGRVKEIGLHWSTLVTTDGAELLYRTEMSCLNTLLLGWPIPINA